MCHIIVNVLNIKRRPVMEKKIFYEFLDLFIGIGYTDKMRGNRISS